MSRATCAGLLILGLCAAACSPATLAGEPLPSPIAPGFTLLDGATGEAISLTSYAGRVVVLTFLYTHCVDTCPLTADMLRAARERLGDAAKDVALIAVSVDPAGDTPAATREFVANHRLQGALRYLIGSRTDLAAVWQAYGVAQASGTSVLHTDVIYLIDKHGRGRVVLHSDAGTETLASDLAILVRER